MLSEMCFYPTVQLLYLSVYVSGIKLYIPESGKYRKQLLVLLSLKPILHSFDLLKSLRVNYILASSLNCKE